MFVSEDIVEYYHKEFESLRPFLEDKNAIETYNYKEHIHSALNRWTTLTHSSGRYKLICFKKVCEAAKCAERQIDHTTILYAKENSTVHTLLLYDIKNDREELQNIAREKVEIVRTLRNELPKGYCKGRLLDFENNAV